MRTRYVVVRGPREEEDKELEMPKMRNQDESLDYYCGMLTYLDEPFPHHNLTR